MNIFIIKGDITKLRVDAIVNAANPSLLGGGGVDGAIHRAAGPELNKECLKLRKSKYPNGLPRGESVVTKAYNLPSEFVIHTVGPRYGLDYQEDNILKRCYLNSLKLADSLCLKSIAFPSISTGVYGFPIEKAVVIVKDVVLNYRPSCLKNIYLILYSNGDYNVYKEHFSDVPNVNFNI